MILLKGFFRHKSTRIYLIVFTTLIVIITVLFNFISYYSNIVTKTYQENSYFLITSNKNNYDKISNKEYIINIQKVILFEPSFSSDFLKNQNVTWPNLLDLNNDFIIAIPNEEDNIVLADNQIAFGIPKNTLENFDNIYDLKTRKVSFKIENNITEFVLKEIYESHFSQTLISNNMFQKLLADGNLYSYIFSLDDYSKVEHIKKSLSKIEDVQEVKFIQTYQSEASFNAIKELKDVITILKYASWIFTIVFLILFLIITKNIVSDEIEKMSLERLLGYNKNQIKKFLAIKLTTLNIGIIFLSTISYIFINILIKDFLEISIDFLNIDILLNIYIVLLLVSLSFCLFLGGWYSYYGQICWNNDAYFQVFKIKSGYSLQSTRN